MGYDDTQIDAVLTRCTRCGRWWYMTHPQPLCQACRRQLREEPR